MFNKNQLTILDWWLFFILMVIPVVNVIVFFIVVFSGDTNKTLKNFVLAFVFPVLLLAGFAVTSGLFMTIFESIQ